MSVYAYVRIKPGANCFQDMNFYEWPPSQYSEKIKNFIGVDDDTVFVAEKWIKSGGGVNWHCEAKGAGEIGGDYRNGGIIVKGGDSVELLTPLYGYKLEIP